MGLPKLSRGTWVLDFFNLSLVDKTAEKKTYTFNGQGIAEIPPTNIITIFFYISEDEYVHIGPSAHSCHVTRIHKNTRQEQI